MAGDNPGLALTRLAPPLAKGDWTGHLEAIVRGPPPPGYADFFARTCARTVVGPAHRCVLLATSESPVVCGMGERTPGENGLTLHPVYGVPYLPGTSLKGILRAWVLGQAWGEEWANDGRWFRELFGAGGHEGAAGVIDVMDALPVSGSAPLLAVDVLTPHHGNYYRGAGAPLGWENPVPVHFLVANAGVTYRVVVEGAAGWVEKAAEWLALALAERGVGAKTRAGYGRFSCKPASAEDAHERRATERSLRARQTKAERIVAELRSFGEQALRGEVEKWLIGGDGVSPAFASHLVAGGAEAAAPPVKAAIRILGTEWGFRGSWVRRATDAQAEAKKRDRARAILAAWDAAFPPAVPATPRVAPVARSGFGSASWSPPVVRPGKEADACRNEALRLADTAGKPLAPTAESIARALVWLEGLGAKPGQLNQVRRAYGIGP